MSCLKLTLPNKPTGDPIAYINEIVLKLSNGTLTGSTFIAKINIVNDTYNLVVENCAVYTAESGTDVSTDGKTALTNLPVGEAYYLFVLDTVGTIGYVHFIPNSDSSWMKKFDNNGMSANCYGQILELATLPAMGGGFYINHYPVYADEEVVDFEDIFNEDICFNLFNLSTKFKATGTFTADMATLITAALTAGKLTSTSLYLQTYLDGEANIDIVDLPIKTQYLYLGGSTTGTIQCSSSIVPFLTIAKTSASLSIGVTMDEASIDNLLIAVAAIPSLSSATFTGAAITLTGTRTSASDTAVATITAAGITVTINS